MRQTVVVLFLAACVALAALAAAEVYFEESFTGDWESRWVYSDWKKNTGEQGKFRLTGGKWHGGKDQKGIQTAEDARFYAISAPLDKPFVVRDKPLVFFFTVKHEQKLDCGGAYLKLLPDFAPATFNGDAPYSVMFGPDICGYGTRKTHFIIGRDGKNHMVKRDIRVETDQLTHAYMLVVRPDNKYEVRIDGAVAQEGSLYDDFSILPPRQIPDPSAVKPADWVDEREIDDPEDVKPEGYDDVPATIPNPDATRPDDWDDEEDGEWQAPQVANPEYHGPWRPKRIPNPAYKGEWRAPMIDNPEYTHEEHLFQPTVKAVGLEVWQVKAGTIFDNVLVTDDVEYAEEFEQRTWAASKDAERKMFDEEEARRLKREEEERKRAEEERKRAEAQAKSSGADDDEGEDDDDAVHVSGGTRVSHDHDEL